jgi:predicted Rossmann-fold nucleotide-binding protein
MGTVGNASKPCGLLNICGYYDQLVAFLEHAVSERLIRPEHRDMILVHESPHELLHTFAAYRAPQVRKWID